MEPQSRIRLSEAAVRAVLAQAAPLPTEPVGTAAAVTGPFLAVVAPAQPVPLRMAQTGVTPLFITEIATRPARWPAQTQLKAAVDFPIFVGSKRSGSTRISAGTRVKVVKISEAGVDISFGEFTTMVALDQTTLGEQMIEAQSDSKTSPQAAEH